MLLQSAESVSMMNERRNVISESADRMMRSSRLLPSDEDDDLLNPLDEVVRSAAVWLI